MAMVAIIPEDDVEFDEVSTVHQTHAADEYADQYPGQYAEPGDTMAYELHHFVENSEIEKLPTNIPSATTKLGFELRLPRGQLVKGLPRLEPDVYSRAIRMFPHTHEAVLRQSTRAYRSMNLGNRPPLQLPVVRSQPSQTRRGAGLLEMAKDINAVPGSPEIQLPFERPTPNNLVVRWKPPVVGHVDTYCVELMVQTSEQGSAPAFKAVATRAGTARSVTLRRLVQGKTYAIRIRCGSCAGWGRYSEIETASLPIGGNSLAMEPVSAGLKDVEMELSWHCGDAGNAGLNDRVQIQWRKHEVESMRRHKWKEVIAPEPKLGHTLTALHRSTAYELRSRLLVSDGTEGVWCLPYTVKTKPRLPAAAFVTEWHVYSRSAKIAYSCPDPGGLTPQDPVDLVYHIEVKQGRSDSSPEEYLTGFDLIETKKTEYTAQGMLPFSTYFLRVRCEAGRKR
jgi:hypothetical protein